MRLAALVLPILMLATAAHAEGIEAHDAYALPTLATAKTGAAFLVIHNHTDADDRLIEVRSDVAERVELHESNMTADGVMQMAHLGDGVAVPAGGEIVLERGGLHVMFMGLAAPFETGGAVVLTLVFEVAGEVTVEVPVAEEPPVDHSGH